MKSAETDIRGRRLFRRRGTSDQQPPKRAVALRYDPSADGAPRVVASGERAVAEAIIAKAREHGVPVYEDPELAALLAQVPIGRQIPPPLYAAVAQVLAFVYRMDRELSRRKGGASWERRR